MRNKKYRCGHWMQGEWTENGNCPSCLEKDRRRRQLDDEYLANQGYPLDLRAPNGEPIDRSGRQDPPSEGT